MALRTLVTLSLLSPCALALATPLPQTVQGGPSGAGAAGHQLRYSLHNLGLAVDGQKFYSPFAEGRVVVVVPEVSQGGVDLNGDGDVLDKVLHLVDPLTGAVTNLGLAHGGIGSSSHERFCFAISEAEQGGVDLNGDGDTLDHVAFLHDATSGVTTNLGLAVQFQGAISADLLVLGVSEAGQGGSDLNADGDTLDSVVFVHELSGGLTHNLGLALSSPFGPISVHAGLASFAVGEAEQGQDLDGDGLLSHRVAHVYDLAQAATVNLGLHTLQGTLAAPGQVYLAVREELGNDLNGDGDFSDHVAHVYDMGTALTANTGLAVTPFPQLTDTHLVFLVSEQQQGGVDLNGDGDHQDQIVHARDLVSGVTKFAPLSFIEGEVRSLGDQLAFEVHEADQGAGDLNGDGDTADHVLHLFDPVSGATLNTGLTNGLRGSDFTWLGDARAGERYLSVQVLEPALGQTDLDGDGDHDDFVTHFYDVQTGAIRNSKRGAPSGPLGEPAGVLLPFIVGESAWGGRDLNGDGDTIDRCLSFWHAGTKAVVDVPMSIAGQGIVVRDRTALFVAWEKGQGNTDLNGDGDALDTVLFLLRVQ